MMSNQDILNLIASATSDTDDSYKSMQDLLRVIASCVGVDEETGEVFLRVKEVEDAAPSLGFGLGLGNPQSSISEQGEDEP